MEACAFRPRRFRVLVVLVRLVSALEGDLINTKLAGTRVAFRRAICRERDGRSSGRTRSASKRARKLLANVFHVNAESNRGFAPFYGPLTAPLSPPEARSPPRHRSPKAPVAQAVAHPI